MGERKGGNQDALTAWVGNILTEAAQELQIDLSVPISPEQWGKILRLMNLNSKKQNGQSPNSEISTKDENLGDN